MQPYLLAIAIWLITLTVVSFWIFNYFRKLSREVNKGNLVKLLEKLLDNQGKNIENIKKLEREIAKIENNAQLHIQKVGLVRFNPFEEMGGDHSFSLSLLNHKDDGVIITGLHSRERTRVYVKNIKAGKCKLGLSNEEKKALRQAQKGKNVERRKQN